MSSLHPLRIALYSALAIFSIILLGLTAARIDYTGNRRFSDPIRSSARHYYDPVVVELLVTSIFSFLWSLPLIYLLHSRKGRGVASSYAFEFLGLFVLWVMYLIGTAIATHYWHGLGFCWGFNQCRILTAIVAWGWINWAVTTFLLLTSCAGQQSSHAGYRDPLHGGGTTAAAAGAGGVAGATAAPETRSAQTGNAPVSMGGNPPNDTTGNMAPDTAAPQYPGHTGTAAMRLDGGTPYRCEVYSQTVAEIRQNRSFPFYKPWWENLKNIDEHTRQPGSGTYARPRTLVHNGILVDAIHEYPDLPYIAVSYTWHPEPEWTIFDGRRVTQQAVHIIERLSAHTPLAIWIDAICIHQSDRAEKEEELPKMTDIYRGAAVVVSLLPEVDPEICGVVRQSIAVMHSKAYGALKEAGDMHGGFIFATAKENPALQRLFGSRWWTRAWTFQEAVVNPNTFLLGEKDDTLPMHGVLAIAGAIHQKAASVAGIQDTVLGQQATFWHSVATLVIASQRSLLLSEAMAAVWRRQSKERHDLVYALLGVCLLSHTVKPDYGLPFHDVLRQMLNAAGSAGDYSWMTWCAEMYHRQNQDGAQSAGMTLVPTPELVYSVPFTGISRWTSAHIPSNLSELGGAESGVMVPFKSTGVVRSVSSPLTLSKTVETLLGRGYTRGDIWDMLFGIRVGLARDISVAVGSTPDPEASDANAAPLLNYAVMLINGTATWGKDTSDMAGERPFTKGITLINYGAMAATAWKRWGSTGQLVIAETQGGVAVFLADCGLLRESEGARIHELPIQCDSHVNRKFVFVALKSSRFSVSATGILVPPKRAAGMGAWQLRKIG
ncbi:heterokaryon incompatibility protein-domain-containing protein [Collybia nuda]|uniref:Heterokaryon incompatibility protein-domain-containing protein n=1 Tax=Collybia nuda TaxID=64659 RepID=A0A9P5XX82_9AGAR|nr:heterokaryon incompatibility protein-domain-containing protein [Collybia nuda]